MPKRLWLLGVAGVFLIQACGKKKVYPAVFRSAIITGYDYRKCMCCGGLMINFTGDSVAYRSPFSLISNEPAYFGFNDSTKFPVYVDVVAITDQQRCNGNYVIIKNYRLK